MRTLATLAPAIILMMAATQALHLSASPATDMQDTSATPTGRTAKTMTGQVGERQSKEEAAMVAGIKPMGRVPSRIQNRVQSRIRNRIDRYYDPNANSISPFAVAADQARVGKR